MSKQLIVATAMAGALLITAPLTGLAEPTTQSVLTEAAVQDAPGVMDKFKAIIEGTGKSTRSLWHSVTDADERLIRSDEKLKLALAENIKLSNMLAEKQYVNGLELVRAKNCADVVKDFLITQVESK